MGTITVKNQGNPFGAGAETVDPIQSLSRLKEKCQISI
jgi:hypothetical protein